MTDFGHIAYDIGLGKNRCRIDAWGAGPFRMVVNGKTVIFEDSDMFGPLFLGKTGIVLGDQRESYAFWAAHHMWVKGGRRTDGDLCIWDEPKPGTYWEDEKGLRHFLTDPDYPPLGYVPVPKPEARG